MVNRLVCAAFHGAPPSAKHEAAHWDGVKTNNAPANLRWATRADQFDDMRRHGTTTGLPGERNPSAILSARQVREIRDHPKSYGYRVTLSRRYGVSVSTIKGIVGRDTWRHVD